jgi:hypothetical protein
MATLRTLSHQVGIQGLDRDLAGWTAEISTEDSDGGVSLGA